MRLTTFSDYTLRVLMYLALEPGKLITIAEIADAYKISGNHLMKVVHQLSRNGIIESTRGKGGGIRLAHAAEEIRLGDVVRASEGGGPIVECMAATPSQCCIAPACQLNHILERAFEALYTTLDEYTLADLMSKQSAIGKLLKINQSLPVTKKSPD
ncbi:MAG: Rrf2 family transcriptional regulator [Sterolibacterium sp.]|jgi:Rrf2 family nitric oxide-sensitive transcriptional repressor|nr:Rrf2 family transcriptional regulator [Sterolibacterium sp.]